MLDIIALRKGPEHIPGSSLLLALSVLAMLVASFCGMVATEPMAEQDYLFGLITYLVGIVFYCLVLIVTGFSRRLLQTLTSIIGCGAILTMLFAAELILFRPFFGANFAGLVAALIIFWSVPVEGHIISRAIDKHWFIGIAIAIAAFTLQLLFQSYAVRT